MLSTVKALAGSGWPVLGFEDQTHTSKIESESPILYFHNAVLLSATAWVLFPIAVLLSATAFVPYPIAVV